MTRPIARMNEGIPELDRGGVYCPANGFELRYMRSLLKTHHGEEARSNLDSVEKVLEAMQ